MWTSFCPAGPVPTQQFRSPSPPLWQRRVHPGWPPRRRACKLISVCQMTLSHRSHQRLLRTSARPLPTLLLCVWLLVSAILPTGFRFPRNSQRICYPHAPLLLSAHPRYRHRVRLLHLLLTPLALLGQVLRCPLQLFQCPRFRGTQSCMMSIERTVGWPCATASTGTGV